MASVELQKVRKKFGELEVIHDVDLTVADGEFMALVGPSGCGKSTLLRLISGLEPHSSGDILFGGRKVNTLDPRERNVAMVFQSYALYPHMTVAENIGFNLKLSKLPKSEIESRVKEAARMLDLEALLERKPAQLSGGQRQRVAMGRAVVRQPAVFLFDEPLSNLDAKLRVQMRAEIKQLYNKVRTTSIYVTHDQIEAMTLADRIVVLNKGRIEQQGTPMELYSHPANVFVAGFIGSPAMNFLRATGQSTPTGKVAKLASGATLALSGQVTVEDGQPITLGLRPEHLVPSDAGQNTIAGTTFLVEPTGAQTHIQFRADDHPVTAVVDGSLMPQMGAPFAAGIAADKIHVFDGDTGRRL